MIASLALCAIVALQPDLPPPHPAAPDRRFFDRLARMYKAATDGDTGRLAGALDEFIRLFPEPRPDPSPKERAEMARYLVPFITIPAPTVDPREGIVAYRNGAPVGGIVIHIGLPAVPALLEELATTPDTKEYRGHRGNVIECLLQIYDKGGEGRQMAAARVRLYAETQPPDRKERLLATLKDVLPPPVPPKPGK